MSNTKRRYRGGTIAAALGVAMSVALVGCGSGSGNSPSSSGSGVPGNSASSSASGDGSTNAKPITLFAGMTAVASSPEVDTTKWKKNVAHPTIGYAGINLINSFQVQRTKSAQLIAAEYGAKLVETNANNDAGKQVSDIQDLLAQGVDALVITPVNTDSLKAVLHRATQAKIPVIMEGSQVSSPDVLSQVYFTNQTFGQEAGQGLCDTLKGHGKVVMLRGVAGVQAETERYDTGKKAMQQCGLTIEGEAYGNWIYSGGQKAAQTLVAQYPKIDGIWSSGSEMTRAAIDVFKAAHRALVPMTGESENGYLQVWKANNLQSVAPIFPTWQTPEAVKLALKALRGEPIKQQYNLQLKPITNANLDQYLMPNLSKDWWSDGYDMGGKVIPYLTPDQVKKIFP